MIAPPLAAGRCANSPHATAHTATKITGKFAAELYAAQLEHFRRTSRQITGAFAMAELRFGLPPGWQLFKGAEALAYEHESR
jgi:hypothetical protein